MKKNVVVVGGGTAGLSAASALVRGCCSVTVLEAKDYFGGRIHTIRRGRYPVELGAEFLHGESQTLRNAIEAAGLSTEEVSEDYRLLENGRLKSVNFWDRMSRLIHHVDAGGPDVTFREFLDAQRLKEQERVQALSFVRGFHAANPDEIGAHSLLRGEYAAEHMENTRQGRVREGYSALIDFLVEEVRAHGAKLLLNTPVQLVEWEPGRVRITCDGNAGTLEADAAVVTLPLGVLKADAVKFQPPLAHKLDAIEQLQFGNVVKVVHIFSERWWPDFGFVVAPDEAVPTWWTDPRGPMLTGWAGGPTADLLLNRSLVELEGIGQSILQRIFPEHADDVLETQVAIEAHDWTHDPYVRGAYSYLPVNGLDLPKSLGAPVDNTLFFAGEATVTDAQTGTVFGAFETGLRAAREVLKS